MRIRDWLLMAMILALTVIFVLPMMLVMVPILILFWLFGSADKILNFALGETYTKGRDAGIKIILYGYYAFLWLTLALAVLAVVFFGLSGGGVERCIPMGPCN
ncbi:MAG: hypothetical protein P8P99_01320 [Maricaulis sp.]|nr:hypothetical protein [Maricaulis sp.]